MTLNGWFIFNGVDTRTLGVTVVPGDLDQAPARNFLVYPKGSANGDFAVDTAGYNNVLRTYWIMIRSEFREKFNALCNALLPVTGYARLEDVWSPDEFFSAYVSAPLQPVVSADEDRGKVLVTFTRKPQRWLKSGETWENVEWDIQSKTNPTPFSARSLLRYTIGVTSDTKIDDTTSIILLKLNDYIITLYGADFCQSLLRDHQGEDILLDLAQRRVYLDGAPELDDLFNMHTRLSIFVNHVSQPYNGDFPELQPGYNHFQVGSVNWEATFSARWRWYTV